MGAEEYLVEKKPLQNLNPAGEGELQWESAPEKGAPELTRYVGDLIGTSGKIGSFSIAQYLYTGTKTVWNDTNTGVHLGEDGIGIGNNIFTVNGSTGALVATSATITGSVTATSGTIGSFTIGTYLYTGTKTAYNDANAGVHVGSDGIGIGNNIFTVSSAGALVATSATITGAITATSGAIGGFTLATHLYTGTKTAYNDANAGVHVGTDGIGIGNNVFTVSSAGALVATSATITGAITASSGSITGPLTMSGASSSIAIGTTPPSSATVGTGLWLDRTGLYGLASNVQQFYLQASDGKLYAGAGAMIVDAASLTLIPQNTAISAAGPETKIKWNVGATAVGEVYASYRDGVPDTGGRLTLAAYRWDTSTTSIIHLDADHVLAIDIYPGNQLTRYISDNGSNIVVDSVVVGTHTHGGAGQGGTVPMSAVSGTISTTQHGALGAITNAHAVADINGAAPLASPTFTGTVTIPTPFTIGAVSMTATGTELNYVAGVTSAIQTQLNLKAPLASPSFTGNMSVTNTGGGSFAAFVGSNGNVQAAFRELLCGADDNRIGLLYPDGAGAFYRTWVSNAGDLTIKSSDPTSNSDGTVVGTQTSLRKYKQDEVLFTDYEGALRDVLAVPLTTFRYRKDVRAEGDKAKVRLGFIGDDAGPDWMWGEAVDQVTVNGKLLAAIKAQQKQITTLKDQLRELRND